jgi:hypothetical protein
VVVGALAGRAVVGVARAGRGAVEGVDRLVAVGGEREVDVLGHRLAGDVGDRADLDVVRLVDGELVARRQVEAPDRRDVARAERHVGDRAGLGRVHHLDAVPVRVAQIVFELVRRRGERDAEVLRDRPSVGDDRELAPVDVLRALVEALLAERAEDGCRRSAGTRRGRRRGCRRGRALTTFDRHLERVEHARAPSSRTRR